MFQFTGSAVGLKKLSVILTADSPYNHTEPEVTLDLARRLESD
jgi:hypothetical protein